ncbi:hypothetical protein ABIA35_000713 [Catenulispora sp. MAP12-49]|jgi:hypothetical protein|uniref:hypothetical protein n=1 Tax=unclassified Catenulispora TaxID=414885 RepID=UPI003510F28D
MIGKQGRVTGRVAPGLVGEVMVEIRGGSEAFHAYAVTPDTEIPKGALVIVVEYQAPRTVYVEPLM